jgi:hypothetical protein
MSWYVNDVSLQGQFTDWKQLEAILKGLMAARQPMKSSGRSIRTTRRLSHRPANGGLTLRRAIAASNPDFRTAVLIWLDRTGPFLEDDRIEEGDDYFEYAGLDVTDSGLGEAARRTKSKELASTFSFVGGAVDFATSPLDVDHGLPEERLGKYPVENVWTVKDLADSTHPGEASITSWVQLVEAARIRFPHLVIPDSVHQNSMLAREPFDAAIRSRALVLFQHLNSYMLDRDDKGVEGKQAAEIIKEFFTGERALFSGESATNRTVFEKDLTFTDPSDSNKTIFAHWHGKISHRFFRMHFEWPLPTDARTLKILYLGPKITKG